MKDSANIPGTSSGAGTMSSTSGTSAGGDNAKVVERIRGIHHITAVASDPQKNLDFYTRVLGLRLVKRTVNFDDPGTYHFYFGDEVGTPGTILTFFPWPGAKRGRQGAGYQTATGYLVPTGSLDAWAKRLKAMDVTLFDRRTRFGQNVLRFEDHDGTQLELVEVAEAGVIKHWADGPLGPEMAIRGFHSATLTVRELGPTEDLLVKLLGFTKVGSEAGAGSAAGVGSKAGRTRFAAAGPGVAGAVVGQIVDVLVDADGPAGQLGAGVVHHLALRADDEAQQGRWQDRLAEARYGVTDVRDRNYFRSIYFRERGGVLFEIATDGPGFDVDEPRAALGMGLKLPSQYESGRARAEAGLKPIRVPEFAEPDLGLHLYRFESTPRSAGTLVLLHGTGGDERDLLPLGREVAPKASLLSPRGNVMEGEQARFFRRLREGVFDEADLAVRTAELSRWLGAAQRRYALEAGRTAFVGFSNGANTAAAMLLSGRASGVKQAVLIRAMVPFDDAPSEDLKGTRVLLLSGREDPIVPLENAERLAAMFTAAGAEVEHRVLETGHGLVRQDLVATKAWLAAGGL